MALPDDIAPKQPMLSIITVVYNAEAYIEDTIKSVLAQGYQDYEFIIIDGASEDGTLEIINQYRSSISKVISAPDKGIYDAMNKGLALANGTYIAYKNAGDYYAPEALTLAMNTAHATYADVIYGDTEKLWDVEGRTSLLISDHHKLKVRSCLDHRSAFVRRAVHRPFNLSYKLAADYDLFCELVVTNHSFIKIDTVLSQMQGGGASDNAGIYTEIRAIQAKYFGQIYAALNYYKLHVTYAKLKAQNHLLRLVLGAERFKKFKARKQAN